MKLICIGLNVLLVLFTTIMVVNKGFPRPSEDEFWLVIFVLVTPAVTLFYLLFASSKETWLGLYFEEKRLRKNANFRS